MLNQWGTACKCPGFSCPFKEMNAERLTGVALMEAVVRRDSDAMAAIYERYESMLRVVISSILHEGGETGGRSWTIR
jgi:hypothetical protein